jgi:hypothetical protein
MDWRRKPRTLTEELLSEGPREAEPSIERPHARSSLGRFAVAAGLALLIVALKLGISHLPAWIGLAIGALFVGHYVSIFVRSTKREGATSGRALRVSLFVWLAICVMATLAIAAGGFQQDDRALLGIVWPILALIWIAYRLRVAAASPRPGTGFRRR